MRPALEKCLLERVSAHRNISLIIGIRINSLPAAPRILDATGRRAISAAQRYLPANPAVLRAIIVRGSFSRAQQAFRLASLPTGYAYRLGMRDALMVGLVQGRDQWRESAAPFAQKLRLAGVDWLLAGMSGEASQVMIGGVASVQWSSGPGPVIRVGDAAIARDALASQGIANGISAGLSLFENPDAETTYFRRVNADTLSHLSTLRELLQGCVHREHPFWAGYSEFLACQEAGFALQSLSSFRRG
jgi:hypothetical protein